MVRQAVVSSVAPMARDRGGSAKRDNPSSISKITAVGKWTLSISRTCRPRRPCSLARPVRWGFLSERPLTKRNGHMLDPLKHLAGACLNVPSPATATATATATARISGVWRCVKRQLVCVIMGQQDVRSSALSSYRGCGEGGRYREIARALGAHLAGSEHDAFSINHRITFAALSRLRGVYRCSGE